MKIHKLLALTAVLIGVLRAEGDVGNLKDVLRNAFEKSLDEVYKKYQNNPLLQQSIQHKEEKVAPVVSQQNVKPKDVVFKRRILKKVLNNEQKADDNRILENLNPLALMENLIGNRAPGPQPKIRGFVSEVKSFTGPDGRTRVEHFTEPINGGPSGIMLDKPQISIEELNTPIVRENPLEMLLDGGLRPKPKQVEIQMEIPLKKPSLNIEPTINPLLDLMKGNQGGEGLVQLAPRLDEPEIIVEEIPRMRKPIQDLAESNSSSSDEDDVPIIAPKKKVNVDELGDLLGDFLSNEIDRHEDQTEPLITHDYHTKEIEPDVVVIGGDAVRRKPDLDPFSGNDFPIVYQDSKPSTRRKRVRRRRRKRLRRRKRVAVPNTDDLAQNQFVTQLADLLMKPAERGKLLDDTQLSRKADPLSIRVEPDRSDNGLLNILSDGLTNDISDEEPNYFPLEVKPNKIRIAANRNKSSSSSDESSQDNLLDQVLNNKASSSSSSNEEEIDPDNHYPLLNENYKSHRRPFKNLPTVGHRNGGSTFTPSDIESLMRPFELSNPINRGRTREPGPIYHRRNGNIRRRGRIREPGPIYHKKNDDSRLRARRIKRRRDVKPVLSLDDLSALANGILIPIPFKERKLNLQRRS